MGRSEITAVGIFVVCLIVLAALVPGVRGGWRGGRFAVIVALIWIGICAVVYYLG